MHRNIRVLFICWLVLQLGITSFAADPPSLFTPQTAEGKTKVQYFGQPAEAGRITLNASNGFFDPGDFVAIGSHAADVSEREFIPKHFDALQIGKSDGFARWHLWIAHPGSVVFKPQFEIPSDGGGAKWEIRMGDQRQTTVAGSNTSITFQVDVAGKQTIEIGRPQPVSRSDSRLSAVDLSGNAIKGAKLLRVRWRPSAVHASFQSSTCDAATLWVFESKNLNGQSSYSPMTTPFGYFGTTFGGRKKPRGFNFSMWAAKARDNHAPPLPTMPHIIATGNPDADFSGFGHEGSGVKLRGWDCLDWNPQSVVQALRVDPNGGKPIYYGYFFDAPRDRWVLYAAGIKPSRNGRTKPDFDSVGSFCEIPGPPHVQRTGDVVRTIARRGWLFGTDKKWHRVDSISTRDKQSSSARSVSADNDGWLLSHAGGMGIHERPKLAHLRESTHSPLPSFLQPDKAKQLFELPVEFGKHRSSKITSGAAQIQYDLQRLGDDAIATLYYGPVDCITFVARPLHATEKKGASKRFYSADRTWAAKTSPQRATRGMNQFQLTQLQPNTVYYYRIFVTHASGKSWGYDSGRFKTKP